MSNVFWITGLSGAGKTTLAEMLTAHFRSEGRPVVMLDGDIMREALGASTKHTRDERLALGFQYAGLARMIARQGVTVIVATVGLFREIHQWNREHQPGFVEIYLKVDLEELRRRDPKGIYARFDAGLLDNVAGLDLQIDEPVTPELTIENHKGIDPEASLKLLLQTFEELQANQRG